jgi:hypothetical protein
MSKSNYYSNTKHTSQSILNDSFDDTTGVLATLPLEFDPNGSTKRTVTGNLALKYVVDGTKLYVGEATIGSVTSDPLWRIYMFDSSTGQIKWADGNDSFDNIFDNYKTTITYL